jgi:hypothetical protein
MDDETRRRIEAWPCWSCLSHAGAALHHQLAQTSELPSEAQRSPTSGLPIGCCRIRAVPIVTSDDASVFR